jgi:hypothetical protein
MTPIRQTNAPAIFLIVLVVTCSVVAVAQERKLYRFRGSNDGAEPKAGLIVDGAGNLYGTTYSGGSLGYKGTVFQLVPPSALGTNWTENVLYDFPDFSEGQNPWAGLNCRRSWKLVWYDLAWGTDEP